MDPLPEVRPSSQSESTPQRGRDWQRIYASRLILTDLAALVWAVGGASFLVYDAGDSWAYLGLFGRNVRIDYLTITVGVVVLWMAFLAVFGTRRSRVVGTGAAEYKGVVNTGLGILLTLVLLAFIFDGDLSRGFTFAATAAGTAGLVLSRALWRVWLNTRRQFGHYAQNVVIVGSSATATLLAKDLRRNYQAGYWIVGACISDGSKGQPLPGTDVPVLGDVDEVGMALEATGADTVLIAGGHQMTPSEVRALSWSLEPGRQHLIVSPSLTDVAGPRIHSRPVAGLPLIHIETPRYEGADRALKRLFDIVGAAGLLLVLAPVLIAVALIIKITSPGPVLFSHQRIGKDGRPFPMLKFRSMIPDADAMLQKLLLEQGKSDKPLFKIENDPRITPIGRFIRKYSIDEVPQLINVLRGDMSLVGPRPQVAKEVELYDNAAARRLFVKPGMTGLWQVSGRSNLGWDESVRLDLYYVENWSMAADLSILWKTFRAVLASDGAV
jgi:exopolysaccharide biosynthesis polyprenyl glycosylphosphotransferase